MNVVNPGVHSAPAGPEHPDFGAGGTSVTEVLFRGAALPGSAAPYNSRDERPISDRRIPRFAHLQGKH